MLQGAELFKAIVIGGALSENGMVSFSKVLKDEDAEAIRAHLTRVANNLKANPPAPFAGFGPPPGPPPAPGAAAPAEQAAAGLHQ
jgi:hypothetical protein